MIGRGTIRTEALMGTVVTMEVLEPGADDALARAFDWFHEIEQRCSRFDEQSELMQLTALPSQPVEVSPILFEAVRFALAVAEETEGAFDPTVGHRVAALGYDRNHRTGQRTGTAPHPADVSYRDILIDPVHLTITLLRPLTLDLGAVAKGLAIDMAARELAAHRHFAIDAGGDLYMGGYNRHGAPWSVGIRHPRQDGELIATVNVSDQAVCTSGDYERPGHLVDPRLASSPSTVASATVVADGAMLADALATAAFVLGPERGIEFLERMGVDGLIVTPELQRRETAGFRYAA